MLGKLLDDGALVSRCLSWGRGAWETFLARHGSFVRAEARRQLLRYLGRAGEADVEDACQEALSLLMKDGARTLRQFRRESSLPPGWPTSSGASAARSRGTSGPRASRRARSSMCLQLRIISPRRVSRRRLPGCPPATSGSSASSSPTGRSIARSRSSSGFPSTPWVLSSRGPLPPPGARSFHSHLPARYAGSER